MLRLNLLWMDEILHHLETMGSHGCLVFTGESTFQGFLGGAGLRPSTVGHDWGFIWLHAHQPFGAVWNFIANPGSQRGSYLEETGGEAGGVGPYEAQGHIFYGHGAPRITAAHFWASRQPASLPFHLPRLRNRVRPRRGLLQNRVLSGVLGSTRQTQDPRETSWPNRSRTKTCENHMEFLCDFPISASYTTQKLGLLPLDPG